MLHCVNVQHWNSKGCHFAAKHHRCVAAIIQVTGRYLPSNLLKCPTIFSYLQAVLKAVRAEHEHAASTVFELSAQLERERLSHGSEVEALAGELAQGQQRAQAAEQQLQSALAGSLASPTGGTPPGMAQLQDELAQSEEQVVELRARLQDMEEYCRIQNHKQQQASLEQSQEMERMRQRVAELTQQLDVAGREAAEHGRLQQRAAALQGILELQLAQEGYGQEAARQLSQSVLSGAGDSARVVGHLLHERQSGLVAERQALRCEATRLKQQVAELQVEVADARGRAESHAALVARLEEDLAAAAAPGTSGATAVEQGDRSPCGPAEHPNEMLAIVTSQRDRYKQRVTTLEREAGGCRQ